MDVPNCFYLFQFGSNVLKRMNGIYKLPALCCFQHRFFQRNFHETQLEQSNFLPVGLFCYSQSLLKVPNESRVVRSQAINFVTTYYSYQLPMQVGKKERNKCILKSFEKPSPSEIFHLGFVLLFDLLFLMAELCL